MNTDTTISSCFTSTSYRATQRIVSLTKTDKIFVVPLRLNRSSTQQQANTLHPYTQFIHRYTEIHFSTDTNVMSLELWPPDVYGGSPPENIDAICEAIHDAAKGFGTDEK